MITLVLTLLGSVWLLWVLYVFTMGVYRAPLSGRLKGITTWMSVPVVAIAYVADIFVNFTFATVLFLDWPKELLTTARLQRYMREGTDWRFILAKRICDDMLDVFDPDGAHC